MRLSLRRPSISSVEALISHLCGYIPEMWLLNLDARNSKAMELITITPLLSCEWDLVAPKMINILHKKHLGEESQFDLVYSLSENGERINRNS